MYPDFWPAKHGMKTPAACWLAGLLGTAIALLLPLLLLLGGFAIDVINRDHERIEGIGLDTLSTPGSAESFGSMTRVSKLGPFEWNHRSLPWVGSMEGSKSSLGLLGLFGVGLLLCTWMQWMNRRASVHTALDTEQQLHESLYRHSGALAIERGLSAQADLLRSFHNQAIPAIRSAVVDWYQVFPMVLMLGILLLLLAAAIHPWLTVAAVLAGLIVRNLYQMHLYRQINEHAIDQQRWGNAQEQLSKIAQDAPLMATIHSSQETFESFRSSFQNYRTAGSNVLSWEKIKSPVIASTTVLLGIGILFLLALGMLDPRKHLSLGAACVWIASVSMALVAWVRFSTAWRVLKKSQPKLKAVYDYLAIESKPTLDSKAHSPIAGNSDSTSSSGRSTPNRLSQGEIGRAHV